MGDFRDGRLGLDGDARAMPVKYLAPDPCNESVRPECPVGEDGGAGLCPDAILLPAGR